MKRKRLTLTDMSFPLVVCLMVLACPLCATPYAYTPLNVPGATQGTVAYGINASGQVAGVFYDDKGSHGFVYNGTAYTTLDAPKATDGTFAYGINTKGQVVGNYVNETGKHGFIYTNGVYTTVDNPNGWDTNVTGINSNGQVVGNFRIGTTGIYGFAYDPATNSYFLINNPNASAGNTSAMGINDHLEAAGFFYKTGAGGFFYDGKKYITLNAPKAAIAGTFIYGLNNTGQMAGVYYDSKGAGNSFVFDGSLYDPLMLPNTKTTFANGINDSGQVVGYFTDSTGSHGFIAHPVLTPNIATQLAFRNLQPVYKVGETLTLTLQEQVRIRTQALDLWIAVRLPNGELRYFSANEPGVLNTSAKPYKTAVSPETIRHAIGSMVIPTGSSGRYTVYALFTELGGNLGNLTSTARSNIAMAEFDFR